MASLKFMDGKWQIVKYDSCPYWSYLKMRKWQQHGNNFIAVFCLSPIPSKMFFNLSTNNPVAGSWNQSDI